MKKFIVFMFLFLVVNVSATIVQLDTENADRDLTSIVTVLTDTPNASRPVLCQGIIYFGDGTKNLDGTGGLFEFTITIGGQTIQSNPQIIDFTTEVRASVWTMQFPVPTNAEVILRVKSPNGADTDVDIVAYLYDVFPPVTIKDDAITDAKINDAAWQELIELMFTYGTAASYGDDSGSLVDRIIDGASAEVWDEGARTLTALDEDSTTIDIDGSAIGSVTAAVTTDAASRTASKADVTALATSSALSTHDAKLDTVDNFLDTEVADIIDMLKAVLSKAYTLLTAVGTYDPSTDSLEAQQENPQGPPIID